MYRFQKTMFLLFAIAGRMDCHKGSDLGSLEIAAIESEGDIEALAEYDGKKNKNWMRSCHLVMALFCCFPIIPIYRIIELMDSVAEADEKNLPPSRAGFILTKEAGEPNVIFGLRDGTLAVTGINY